MKKFMAFLAVLILTISSFALNAEAASFKDLSDQQRFYKEMMFLEGKDVIAGYPDGTFRPDAEVTRAAAAIMIGRSLGLDGTKRATKFSDVGESQEASGFIASAVEKGIISGYPDGTYRPDQPVTRGQMAIFLSRAFSLKTEAAAPFSDVSSNMQAYVHIKRILAENITQGYPDNTYRPEISVTRAQFSAFLARALDDSFKVELPAKYSMDINKVYHYSVWEGEMVLRFAGKFENKWNKWDVYVDNDKLETMIEYEDDKGYYSGYPYSEYYTAIKYPVKVGQSWNADLPGGEAVHTIASVNETVQTPAGTFKNVVRVTDNDGWNEYYAPNVGMIKITLDGEVLTELTKLTNR